MIRSIESVFDVYDEQPAGARSIKSLFYFRDEIEVQYAEWSRSQTGKSDGSDSRYLYRSFDSLAVANPAYCRIVQNLLR